MARRKSAASTRSTEKPRRRAARGWKREPEERRRRIVEAALARFGEDGYASTTTATIARDVGISEGTLFHHFPNKRVLLAAVGEQAADRVLAAAFAGIDPSGPPPDLEALLRRLFRFARENQAEYKVFAIGDDVFDLASGFAAKRGRVVAGVETALAQWSARGFFRRMEPAIVAELLFAQVDAAVRRLILEDRWEEEDRWVAELSRSLQALLLPARPDGEAP